MATFYLDLEGGNDANDGTTFANRWKTFTSGATAARIAPGDTIRVMASPTETLVGNATWTSGSKTITLASAVTANITDCETAWTVSTNVTGTTSTSVFKENTKSVSLTIASGFTTGLAAYFATGALDLSAYQQVSFWVQVSATLANATTLSLRLCSDVAGATSVHTIPIPAIPATGLWIPVTVDLATNLSASIQSVALYADSDPGAIQLYLDNIIACKASSSADSLSLTSLIGKVHNLNWAATTAYSLNDIRIPSVVNRNGYRYIVTTAGTTAGSEPTWPSGIGMTVTDGTVVWTCDEVEDTWYSIQSINGTTVKLDNSSATAGSAGRGYSETTETVATYKRETIKMTQPTFSTSTINTITDSGTADSPITFSGGWNRTDMSTQTGQTWISGQNGNGTAYNTTGKTNVVLSNLNAVRCTTGNSNDSSRIFIYNCHFNNCSDGIQIGSSGGESVYRGLALCNNGSYGFSASGQFSGIMKSVRLDGNISGGLMVPGTSGLTCKMTFTDICTKNNGQYGVNYSTCSPLYINGLTSALNVTGGCNSPNADAYLTNAVITDGTEFGAFTNFKDVYIYSQKHDGVENNHINTTDGGTIVSAIDQRHTASGISWKFRPTSTNRSSGYPLQLSIAKIACTANTTVSVTVWTYRDSTNIHGLLSTVSGKVKGVEEKTIACDPTINTWVQSSALTFTPLESGVVEIVFKVWDGTGTTNNFWIDDIAIAFS